MNGYPGAQLHPSPNYRQNRRAAIDHVVIHTTELDLAQSLRVLTDPDRTVINENGEIEPAPVSAHYLVSADRIYQLVDEGNEAWHARNANRHTIGVEIVGRAANPSTWSPGIVAQLSRLFAWLSSYHGIPLIHQDESTNPNATTQTPPAAARGFVSHEALDPSRRSDPGMWLPWNQIKQNAIQIQSGTTPSAAGPIAAAILLAIGLAWVIK
jgi:N-acetyl-anhydromuramyl-L-alanine amidase AmpD